MRQRIGHAIQRELREREREMGRGGGREREWKGKQEERLTEVTGPKDSSSSVCPAEEGLAIAPPRTSTQIV